MCPSIGPVPPLLSALSARSPFLWITVIGWALFLAVISDRGFTSLVPSRRKRLAIALLLVGFLLLEGAHILLFAVLLPWSDEVARWAIQQTHLLASDHCSLDPLDRVLTQAYQEMTFLFTAFGIASCCGAALSVLGRSLARRSVGTLSGDAPTPGRRHLDNV
jgi:hypothetical protein